jgi:4-aminobutyrate aminotransferase/(S)-3-amino-2-methylpropionate transaminase
MEEIDLNKRGIKVGIYTRNRLKKLQEKCPQIGDVRGLGAFLAVEFVKNGDPRQPDGELTGKIVKACAERGLVLLSAGTHKNVLRILSPLVITDQQLDQGLGILEEETLKACGIES